MGRIFSYEEIVTDKVPQPEDFIAAREHFTDSALAYIESGAILGVCVYGSVAINMANWRSDFDVFGAIKNQQVGLEATRNLAEDVRIKTGGKIPVSISRQTPEALGQGRHEMDRFFGEHLTSGHRYIIGKDPTEGIVFPNDPASAIMREYLAQKKRTLGDTYDSRDPLDPTHNGLQRLLELPAAVGRKALQALAETNHISKAVEKTADKQQVIQATKEVLEPEGLVAGLNKILSLDKQYNHVLKNALLGHESKQSYEDNLIEIHSSLKDAVDWIELLEKMLIPKLENPRSSLL